MGITFHPLNYFQRSKEHSAWVDIPNHADIKYLLIINSENSFGISKFSLFKTYLVEVIKILTASRKLALERRARKF